MSKETIEEFLARGGAVEVIPKQPIADIPVQVPIVSTMPENRLLSLDEGAHYFAETRKSKNIAQVRLVDVVDNFDLPKDVVDRLRGACEQK